MNFALAFLYFLSPAYCPGSSFSAVFAEKNAGDSIIILVKVQYPEDLAEDLKNNSFFLEQLNTDFKQRSKKQNNHYLLCNSENNRSDYDLVLNFTFYNLKFGDERTEQSMRLATMKNMQTVFDREAEQHKRQDVDYSADVTHIKRSVDCNASVIMTINRPGNDSILFNKVSDAKYNWVNEYVTYKGDKEALSSEELQLTKNKPQETPSQKTFFKELLKTMLSDITVALDSFLKVKKGF